MKLLLAPDYIEQATLAVRHAKTRVILLSMIIADHPATHEFIEELKAAAKRGVAVSVAADIFTYGEVSGSFLPLRYNNPHAKMATRLGKSFKAAGVTFHWLGRSRSTLLVGRTHGKWCIVDDEVFVFGGVNIYQKGIESADYMFKVSDQRLADRLAHEYQRIKKADRSDSNYPSVAYELDGNSILIDGGMIGQSLIYRRAYELAAEATDILFVSQYCPTGKLARMLKAKEAKLYFNRLEQTNFLNGFFIRMSLALSGLKTTYQRKAYLHAKFVIFTMPDGSQVALTGSHNFAYTTVLFGTREIALETKDPEIINQLKDFYKKYIS